MIIAGYPITLIPPDGKTINTYLPSELLTEIFLYSIDSNQMKSGHLASVCGYWRSVITAMPHLWSTLRVGTWTETERVATWLQRAYPKKVAIDAQRDRESPSKAPSFAALQDALATTGQWHELTISSFPSEDIASQLGFRGAMPMKMLRTLHVDLRCVHSPSFTHLLDLVPTEAPLSELRLHTSFASAYFFQPHWLPVLQNLTVLIVNGRNIHEPFELLPAFTQLHTLEADHLTLPWYEPDANLPILCTLHKLQLRASSVQWMAGRRFACLEECAILFPCHWVAVQLHGVELPLCRKLSYHGYPMTTVQYFHAPRMRAMELKSHDCKEQRVNQQLRHICRVDGRISKLTTLHLTLQCSEQAFIKILNYLGLLQELVLSITYLSPSWKNFPQALVAKPSSGDQSDWRLLARNHQKWEQWCSSQTWHANTLPHLKYLGIQCPKGFSQSERLDNCPLFRLVGWTRAQSTPPLEHLKVWEGRGTADDIVVDYISTGYLDKHPQISSKVDDFMIVRAMVTQSLVIEYSTSPFFYFRSTALFRQLQDLEVNFFSDHEIVILPYLEQIKRLEIWHGIIPAYPSNIGLPLVHTLHRLRLEYSTFSWMLGRTFKVLREFRVYEPPDMPDDRSRHGGMQVGLPGCTILELWHFPMSRLHFLSCPEVQILQCKQSLVWSAIGKAPLKSLHDFLCNCSCLSKLEILIPDYLGRDSLIQFVFGDAWEQEVWRDIKSVEVIVWFPGSARDDRNNFLSQISGDQQHYEKCWKEFKVTMGDYNRVIVGASM